MYEGVHKTISGDSDPHGTYRRTQSGTSSTICAIPYGLAGSNCVSTSVIAKEVGTGNYLVTPWVVFTFMITMQYTSLHASCGFPTLEKRAGGPSLP